MGSPVWSRDGIIAVANAHKGKVKLTFAYGASLPDPDKLFNAGLEGNARRAIDFFEGDGGIVEVDETFIGGKAHNRHWDRRDGRPGGTASGKAIVAGAIRRKGNVVARVVENVSTSTPEAFEAVSNKG